MTLVPMPFARAFAAFAAVALPTAGMSAQQLQHRATLEFVADEVVVDGAHYPYRLLVPLPQQRGQDLPLVVFLHGAGERGADNRLQLHWLPELLASPAARVMHACWLLAVQCPSGEQWSKSSWAAAGAQPLEPTPTRALRAVQQAVERVSTRSGVDAARVYATGLSMGGFGAFELVVRDPDRYAALLAICGGCDPAVAERLLPVPTSIWHGADDSTVPVEQSRGIAARLLELGGAVHYRELPGRGHDVWREAYGGNGALPWLFAQDLRQQRRGRYAEPAIVPRPETVVPTDGVFRLPANPRLRTDDALRPQLAWLLDELAAGGWPRPTLFGPSEPLPGDIVFRLADPATVGGAAGGYELHVGACIEVTVGDASAVRRATAALFGALATWPGFTAPCGQCVDSRPTAIGAVVLAGDARWTARELRELLRECWFAGVVALHAPQLAASWSSQRERRELLQSAEHLGVALVDEAGPAAAAAGEGAAPGQVLRAAAADAVGDVLARAAAASRPAGRPAFELLLDSATPAQALAAARRLLPALAEASLSCGRPVHLASLRTRMAARQR